MENIWEYGLVPFQNEAEILTVKDEFLKNGTIDQLEMVRDKTSKRDIIFSLYYSAVKPWVPFADCGCEPPELYTILRCNALVCALATFSCLDKRKDRAVPDLVHQKSKLYTGKINGI